MVVVMSFEVEKMSKKKTMDIITTVGVILGIIGIIIVIYKLLM